MSAKALLLWLVGVVMAGCGIGEGGMPLPRQQPGDSYPGQRMELAAEMEMSAFGCFLLVLNGEAFFVIWPAGSDDANLGESRGVRLPNGQVVTEGDTVVGTGAFTPAEPLLLNRDTAIARAITGCAPDATELVVLDAVARGL